MSDLVMRLETAAGKINRAITSTIGNPRLYDLDAAGMRDLFQEAARRIKQLEHEGP
jgi:hypothetical protein